jgi:cytochrome c5
VTAVLLLAAVSAAAGLSPLGGDVRGSIERYTAARALPEGIGREITTQSCTSCHSAMLITQQRKDSTAWAKTIATMQSWGAPIPDSLARDSIRTFLVAHFGPREKPTATR